MSILGNKSTSRDGVNNSEEDCRRFSLEEIQSATNNFHDAQFIAKGGFGEVYKGVVEGDSGEETNILVAIKRLKKESKQGEKEFWMEIKTLSKVGHTNLVALIGYCNDLDEMIIVYEYVCNGTLADHLYKLRRRQGMSSSVYDHHLSWEERLNICIGAARGLAHLHEHDIIHRDVKTENILLDENWVAKVSDFGLSKFCEESETHVSTDVKGSFGYFDPEYFLTHRLTKKSDVYAFGVVLFEVLCARPPVERDFGEEQRSLARWAQNCFKKGTVDKIVDPSLKGMISAYCLKKFTEVAIKCLNNHPKGRPTMTEVVWSLELVLASETQLRPPTGIIRKAMIRIRKLVPSNSGKITDAITRHFAEDPSLEKAIQLLQRFSLAEVRAATNKFDTTMIIGEVSDPTVYKGVYKGVIEYENHSRMVAIKRYNVNSTTGWLFNEVKCQILVQSKIRHLHIVRLVGYCSEDDELILVDEYMAKGSLSDHLHGTTTKKDGLTWEKRLEIITSAARGLLYLHSGTQQTVVHRDFKPNNILLDENWVPKLSGLEMSKTLPDSSSGSTRVLGTFGYLAPEYCETGELTVKSDVYSFGVVLLQLLTGRQALCQVDGGFVSLLSWFRANMEMGTVDQHLINQVSPDCATEYVKIAESCLGYEGAKRPSMEEVLERLLYALQLQKTWTSRNG